MSLLDPKNAKLKVLFDELQADKQKMQEQSNPLREERDRLRADIQPTEDRIRQLNQQIKAIESPLDKTTLADIDMQISAIAKAAGGIRMSESPNLSGHMVDQGEAQTIDASEVGTIQG